MSSGNPASTKRLLIAGGGYADIPLIRAGQALGYHVISSGNRAEDLGHQVSDSYRAADFADPQAMLRIAEQEHIDAICACCNDFSAISAAYVAEQMGLPGHDSFRTTQRLHHKDSYRQFALSNDIPTPWASSFHDLQSALAASAGFSYPLMVKPVDLTGGKGINRVDSAAQVVPALQQAFAISRAKRVVVEEFIEGSRHGLSTFIRDGKVVFHFADNEHYYLNQYLVSAASTPAQVPAAAIDALIRQSEHIAKTLRLGDGIFHIQYILRQQHPIIIEICRRPPGDLYIELVRHATGVDYPHWLVRAAAGLDCSALSQQHPNGYYTRHCVMTQHTGTINDVHFSNEITDNVIDQLMWWKPGDRVSDILTAKLGIVFLKFTSSDEMIDKTTRMQELIQADISSD